MAKIADQSSREFSAFLDEVRENLRRCDSLEAAAQRLVELISANFSESVVLARFFVTLPMESLPASHQKFVGDLMADNAALLTPATPVLTLLGTAGEQKEWNDRRNSQGHQAIPLASVSFVDSIPMIARLLKEMEVELDWLHPQESAVFTQKELSGGWIGTFYVREASQALDYQNRPIITAQDFVARHGVQTVFALAGFYPQGMFFTLLLFTRDTLEKARIAPFTTLVPLIRASTSALVRDGKIFSAV